MKQQKRSFYAPKIFAFRARAQIKMFETIAVMVVFFFLIAFGLTFYFVIAKASAQKDHQRTLQLQTIQTAQKISTIPEFDCVKVGVQIENCFDEIKVAKFSERIRADPEMKEAYFDIFGFVDVKLNKIFPNERQYDIYSKTRPDAGYDITMLPVLVYEPVQDSFGFGVLEVKFYET